MYDVLIVEDCSDTGTLLTRFLSKEVVERYTRERYADQVAMSQDARDGDQVRIRDVNHEPGAGQLAHLRHGIRNWQYDDGESLVDGGIVCPTPHLYPPNRLDILGAAATIPDRRARADKILEEFKTGVSRVDLDRMIVVVDLALLRKGGQRSEGQRMRRARAVADESNTHVVSDPRRTLRTLTGFRVIEALRDKCPVIATTYSANPLVAQHCLVNGAFAVVRKPVPEVDKRPADPKRPFDMQTAVKSTIADLENNAKCYHTRRNERLLDVLIVNYGMTIVGEVLKAVSIKLHHADETAPPGNDASWQ